MTWVNKLGFILTVLSASVLILDRVFDPNMPSIAINVSRGVLGLGIGLLIIPGEKLGQWLKRPRRRTKRPVKRPAKRR